jgi:hypothetical protein
MGMVAKSVAAGGEVLAPFPFAPRLPQQSPPTAGKTRKGYSSDSHTFSRKGRIIKVYCLTTTKERTMRHILNKKQVRLATLLPILGIILAACSAAATPAPINTSAPSNTLAPTNTVAPAANAVETAEPYAPADTSSSPLVGKWEGIDVDLGALTIEFKSDGVYEITDSSGTFPATYEIVDDDTFILIYSGQSEPATVDFVRSGDTLTMTMTIDGSTLELQKMP